MLTLRARENDDSWTNQYFYCSNTVHDPSRCTYSDRRALKNQRIKLYLLDCIFFDPFHFISFIRNTIKGATECEASAMLIRAEMKGRRWTKKEHTSIDYRFASNCALSISQWDATADNRKDRCSSQSMRHHSGNMVELNMGTEGTANRCM